MTADLFHALLVAKYSARNVFGVIRKEPDQDELLKLLFRQMILQVLSDSSCLEELTDTEIDNLEGILILHS
jgi:hypothetical protein